MLLTLGFENAVFFLSLLTADQISSIFWLFHSDLQEVRVTSVLEYMSSMVATVQPLSHSANGQRGDLDNPSLLEHSFGKGKFLVRFKRRNGRVREMVIFFSLCFFVAFISFIVLSISAKL